MAVVCITEFSTMPTIPGAFGNLVVPVGLFNGDTVLQTNLTLSSTATASAAFAATTRFIRVHNTGICSIAIGGPGVTTASSTSAGRLPADHTEYFGVNPGNVISVVTAS